MGKGKGGAGCTTSALELAYAATRRTRGDRQRRVGVIDLDPQGNATAVLEPDSRTPGIKDVLAPRSEGQPPPLALRDALKPTAWENVWVAPADRFLANREADMTAEGIAALRSARISGEIDDLVDDVVVDLPRDIGRLSAAGLLGAEWLFITARSTIWGAQGAEEMRYTATRIARKGNPELKIAGYIVAAHENTADAERVLGNLRETFGLDLLAPPVPRRARVPEAIESYHTPCREFGAGLKGISDIYQKFYDLVLEKSLKSGDV
ncbi:ParA family protein [Streptomyces sp. NPDC017940]|uniref:ParA family protein n=1 Tax=Streptomyces sp. NPDC017940 TaxID=3365017 RepID=UPI003799AD5E